jgi:hypothetical protein
VIDAEDILLGETELADKKQEYRDAGFNVSHCYS